MRTARRAVAGLVLALATLVAVTGPAAAAGDTTASTTVKNLRVESLSFTQVTLAWDASTDGSGWYVAEVSALPGYQQKWAAQGTTKTFTGLVQGLTYTASVWPYDDRNNDSAKVSIQFTAPVDTQPPTAPTNLRPVTADGVLDGIAWDPALDDSNQLTYLLYSGSELLFVTNEPGVSVLDLVYIFCVVQPGSTHTLTVQARDVGNNRSPHSDPLTVTFPL